jgi:hypothetical protein
MMAAVAANKGSKEPLKIGSRAVGKRFERTLMMMAAAADKGSKEPLKMGSRAADKGSKEP